jgi:hypothetical protein
MALVHLAYTFEPKPFFNELKKHILFEEKIRINVLKHLAEMVVKDASPQLKKTLEYLRFDEEWLEESNNEISHEHEKFIIVLSQYLVQIPSLSNRTPASFLILEKLLFSIGWEEKKIWLLIRGNYLQNLLEYAQEKVFTTEFIGVDQFGGWLNNQEIRTLYFDLEKSKHHFLSPSHVDKQSICEFENLWKLPALEILKRAYFDAKEMLEMALAGNKALFLLID